MEISIEFRNEQQRQFYWSRARNNCFSGGFNNGKTFIACLRHFTFLSTFPKYRTVMARELYKDLKATTMKTFFKICPENFIERHNEQDGYTLLKNKSEILWMHLDSFDEQSMRGLEINSALIDQAEEIDESIFLVLDARIGRWEKAEVPAGLLKQYEKLNGKPWPLDSRSKAPVVPNYFDILVNPDTTFHWVYRRFHPESLERRANYFFIEAPTDESLGDPETMAEMKNRDEEWVNKYFYGKWGASNAQIHRLNSMSLLEPENCKELLFKLRSNSALFRAMDHGDTSPTCCLWVSAYKGVYIFYREYYVPNALISEHRQNINDLSEDEVYVNNYADPSIFSKNRQKDGAFWTVADEYMTTELKSPPLFWQPADNNEFATRNRINELLRPSLRYRHPITGETPAPGIYFIKRSTDYQYGCYQSILQLQSQRREILGNENGRVVYSDDRDANITDHAYDPIRYFIAMHGTEPKSIKPPLKKNTFAYFNSLLKRDKESAFNF